MLEISIQDLESCNELITHLTTLRSILKYIVKIKKILEIKIIDEKRQKGTRGDKDYSERVRAK